MRSCLGKNGHVALKDLKSMFNRNTRSSVPRNSSMPQSRKNADGRAKSMESDEAERTLLTHDSVSRMARIEDIRNSVRINEDEQSTMKKELFKGSPATITNWTKDVHNFEKRLLKNKLTLLEVELEKDLTLLKNEAMRNIEHQSSSVNL